jgi:hypothetical protein
MTKNIIHLNSGSMVKDLLFKHEGEEVKGLKTFTLDPKLVC